MEPASLEEYAEFRPAWPAFAVYLFGVVVFTAGPQLNPNTHISPALGQLIGSLFLAFILVKRFSSIYRVGPRGVFVETTFPRRGQKQVAVEQIRRIDLRRGITQRLLGVAHVHIYVEGQEGPALKLFGVPRPERFRQLLLDLGAQDQQVVGAWRR
ncbi:MAG: PH domain-containing protein [Desulfarculus sp.]|nr:PH domain-containing protein [Desulfarculus sp.]